MTNEFVTIECLVKSRNHNKKIAESLQRQLNHIDPDLSTLQYLSTERRLKSYAFTLQLIEKMISNANSDAMYRWDDISNTLYDRLVQV